MEASVFLFYIVIRILPERSPCCGCALRKVFPEKRKGEIVIALLLGNFPWPLFTFQF